MSPFIKAQNRLFSLWVQSPGFHLKKKSKWPQGYCHTAVEHISVISQEKESLKASDTKLIMTFDLYHTHAVRPSLSVWLPLIILEPDPC